MKRRPKRIICTIILLSMLLLYAFVLFRTAYLCDDAYITYRVIDNFINGYGLRWNTDERVQAYTHPLWMFFNAGIYFFTREAYFTFIFTSIIISLLTVVLYAFFIAPSPLSAIVSVAILTFSKAFMDYSTSGLENPMTHLLLVLFFILYFRIVGASHERRDAQGDQPVAPTDNRDGYPTNEKEGRLSHHINGYSIKGYNRELFLLGLIAALAAVNRMDTILLYIPPLIYILLKFRPAMKGWADTEVCLYMGELPDAEGEVSLAPTSLRFYYKRILYLAAGFIPLILWELFSIFYYGFPFPNTFYAKLNTGISAALLMKHGFQYLIQNFTFDPITLTIIFVSLFIPFIKKNKGGLPIAFGIILYLIYIVRIGGDYMLGRYFSAPLFMAVILMTKWSFAAAKKSFYFILGFVLFLAFMTPYPTLLSDVHYGKGRDMRDITEKIIDNRAYFFGSMGLLSNLGFRGYEIDKPEEVFGKKIYSHFFAYYAIGCIGFAAGPSVHILDIYALADPLLSHLPVMEKKKIWIGHFERRIPRGYYLTSKTGKNLIFNKDLAQFYDKISLITRGDLFDVKRLFEIWKLNTGGYDHLIKHQELISGKEDETRR